MSLRLNRVFASAMLAVVLAGTAFAAPVQAAPAGNLSLTFDFGNRPPPPPPPRDRICMGKEEIVRGLRNNGYRDARVMKNLGHGRVLAVGRKGDRWYQLRIDTCSGFVDQVQRVRRLSNGSFNFFLDFNDGDNLPPREELVCLVTYYDASDVQRGNEDDIESAELMRRSEAEDIDRPRDARTIFDYDSDREARQNCEYLNSINN
jgi:hypothetical protein